MWFSIHRLFESEKKYKDKCAVCGGPWHQASGQLVGSPTQVKVCGACFQNDIIPLIKDTMDRTIRLSTRDKKEAAALRKKGQKKARATSLSFYQYATSSIGAGKP